MPQVSVQKIKNPCTKSVRIRVLFRPDTHFTRSDEVDTVSATKVRKAFEKILGPVILQEPQPSRKLSSSSVASY